MTRAVEAASWRWLALAGALVGFGFLTKMLQAFLVLPAFGAGLPGRGADVAAAGGSRTWPARCAAVVVSAGWYVALVALWPAGSRPYIAGSTDDSVLELALGYNGLGRIFGGDGNPGGGGGRWRATSGSAARPGSAGCSARRSAPRCRGCCRPR